MNQARPWSADEEEDVHRQELKAIFSEIAEQAIALGACGFGIMPEIAVDSEGSFFYVTQDCAEAEDALRSMVSGLFFDPTKNEVWNYLNSGSSPATIVTRRLFAANGDTLSVFGALFNPRYVSDVEAQQIFDRITNLTQCLLEMWFERLRLELDILAERRRGDRLQRYAERDPLTRTCNAVTFRMLAEEMISDERRMNALLLLDVDNFKSVNDVFGHGFGDRYLQQIARAMEATLPRGALVGRIGGDEFAALVPAPSAIASAANGELKAPGEWMRRYCVEVMDRCVQQIQLAVSKLGKADLGSISMGAAIYPLQAKSLDQLFEFADAAVYSNKGKDGKNRRPAVFQAEKHDAFSNRLLGARFQKALASGHIEPYLQPIVDLKTNRIAAFEALARWNDPNRGLLVPQDFRQVFFDPDLAQDLSRTIIRRSLSWLAERREAAPESVERVAINLTTFELIDAEFITELNATLESVGLPWSALMIEVTERVMLGPINGPVFRSLAEMRRRGATIALDDFGTGYDGLQHLKDWPVDILKIDHSFLRDGYDSVGYRPIVRAITDMAAAMGFDVVAEGIESEEVCSFIAGLGCGGGQGEHFTLPLPMSVLTKVVGRDLDWAAIAPRLAVQSAANAPADFGRTMADRDLNTARSATGLRKTSAEATRVESTVS